MAWAAVRLAAPTFPGRMRAGATAAIAKLPSDHTVSAEFTARDTFQKALVMLHTPNQDKQRVTWLQSVTANYRGAEAATKSQEILDQIAAQNNGAKDK